MSHQEMKMRRNFPIDKGLLAKAISFLGFSSQQPQHFRNAAKPDMVGFLVGELNIPVRVVRLLDTGVDFGAIQQAAQFIELCNIDEFPLYELLFMVVKAILFFFADEHGFLKGFLFIISGDKTELFVELWRMLSFSADDPENDLTKIPVHSLVFTQVNNFSIRSHRRQRFPEG